MNLNITGLESIITFLDSANTTVTNLTANACNATVILSTNNTAPGGNSHFLVQSSNFSNSAAGAINGYWHNLTVIDTVFDNLVAANNTNTYPALRHNVTDGSLLTVHNCTFSNIQCFSNHSAYAVGVPRAALMLTDTQFTNCSSQYSIVNINNDPLINGSWLANETVTVYGCTFTNNSAEQAQLYLLGKDLHPSQQMNLYNSRFVGNQALYGAAVTIFAVGTIQVVACTFENNYAIWGLSAFYVYGWVEQLTYFSMRDSVFTGNNGTRQALADPELAGIIDNAECGGLYLSSCKCIGIANSTFENNTGIGLCVHGQLGSSPDCSDSDPIFFNQSTIAGPEAEPFLDDFLDRYSDLVITLDIRDSNFVSNTDAFLVREEPEPEGAQPIDFLTGGAGLDIQDVLFTVLSSNTFISNRGRQGSALHMDTCFTIYIWNCTFDDNTATGQGGAIALVNSHSIGLLLADSTISNGQALFGGAIYGGAGAQITISNGSQLVSNQAVTDGGAIFCQSCQELSLQLQTNLSYNTAGGGGGAVFCDGCVLLQANQVEVSYNR